MGDDDELEVGLSASFPDDPTEVISVPSHHLTGATDSARASASALIFS